MQVNIQCAPSYALAYCYLEAGEGMRAESGAMAVMSAGISVKVDAGPGGVAKGLIRKTLAQESFFMVRYIAQIHGAWVAVAPKYPGDIAVVDVNSDRGMLVQAGSVLAMSDGLSDDVRFAGVGNIALREGATMQHIHGTGKLLMSTYGGMQRFELAQGEQMVVDTGHLVAYSAGMKTKVGPLASLMTAKLSGEGLVAMIEGPGLVYIQTRAEEALQGWLVPDRSKRNRD